VASRSPRLLQLFLVLAGLILILYLARPVWLRGLGYALVRSDEPVKSDIAVVLAGDYRGRRIEKAAELVRQGFVPVVLVDGPSGFFGSHESTFAIQYMVGKGNPASWFIDFPIRADSTLEEARLVLPELRRRNVRSYLLVTSDFHSARAARVFQAVQKSMGYHASMRMVACSDPHFRPDGWWHDREGKKTAFIEWAKTFASAAGQ
jgi:uncharacterized SAM-binding protein YcdF (DUF218 family)